MRSPARRAKPAAVIQPPEQAPVTVEMIEEAFERLRNMVNQRKTPVLLHMLIEKEGRVSGECEG